MIRQLMKRRMRGSAISNFGMRISERGWQAKSSTLDSKSDRRVDILVPELNYSAFKPLRAGINPATTGEAQISTGVQSPRTDKPSPY